MRTILIFVVFFLFAICIASEKPTLDNEISKLEDKSCDGFTYKDLCINEWALCAYYILEDEPLLKCVNKLREFKEDKSCDGFTYKDLCINDWALCAYYLEDEPMLKCVNKLYK